MYVDDGVQLSENQERPYVQVGNSRIDITPDELIKLRGLKREVNVLGADIEPQRRAELLAFGVLREHHQFPVCQYHQATRDYPFLDMSTGLDAMAEDAALMRSYIEAADTVPSPYLDLPGTDLWTLPRATDVTLDSMRTRADHRVALLIAGVFGVRAVQEGYYDHVTEYHQMPLLRKSVPSGGSRHPAECFIELKSAPDLQTGLYHFNVRNNCLRLLDQLPAERLASKSQDSNTDQRWSMDLHLAFAVERDMFRYRDPRSFRAVLVDAGHVDGQLQALAGFTNSSYESRIAIDVDFGRVVGAPEPTTLPRILTASLTVWE